MLTSMVRTRYWPAPRDPQLFARQWHAALSEIKPRDRSPASLKEQSYAPRPFSCCRFAVAGAILAAGGMFPARAAAQSRSDPPPLGAAGEWLTPAKDYASTRFSTLNQITTANVQSLKESWSYTTGIKDGHEGQPLIVGSTMYIVTPWPDQLIAFDLTKPG